MLTTTIFGLNKPQTSDAPSALRTAIGNNADLLEGLLDRRGFAQVATAQQTGAVGPVDLTTAGPSVTLDVPANALAVVRAEATINNLAVATGTAKVTLDIDGSDKGPILQLATNGGSVLTYTLPGSTSGTTTLALAGFLVISGLTAASHTFKLRYGTTVNPASEFSNRKLWVRTLTF